MSPSTTSHPPESQGIAPAAPKIYTAGTLRYDQRQLMTLFFWLMWNDFSIMLILQIVNLNNVLMRDHGATFTQIALLASLGGLITPWINPWVSTWSDRHRSKYGRRRPFLLIATPFFALFLALTPFMPDLYQYLCSFPALAKAFSYLPLDGSVFFIGVCAFTAGLFCAVVQAIFGYLYWDVVPDTLMGRFQSMTKNATLIAGLVWFFGIYGLADHHMKAVYVGTAAFCLLVYMLSVWQIKEGEYPPPDVHKKGGALAPIRAYFVECFSESYYLWIFVGALFFQLGNKGNDYQFFYLHYDLGLSLTTIGRATGWSQAIATAFGLICGFAIGSFTDRLKGVRLMAFSTIILAAIQFACYFIVRDQWTFLIMTCLVNVGVFINGVVIGAFTIEVFPREKLGQFCSAQSVFYQFGLTFITPLIGMFFDHVKYNRISYLWNFVFYVIAALIYRKIYWNWKKKNGHVLVPHAG